MAIPCRPLAAVGSTRRHRPAVLFAALAIALAACGTDSQAANTSNAATDAVVESVDASSTTAAPTTAAPTTTLATTATTEQPDSTTSLAPAISNRTITLDERISRIADAFENAAVNERTPTTTVVPAPDPTTGPDAAESPATTEPLPVTTTTTTTTTTTVTVAPSPRPAVTTTTTPPTTAAAPAQPLETTGRFPSSPLNQIGPNLEGALLGISTGLSTAEREPRFNFLEQQAGREFDIGHVFHAWDKPIPTVDDLIHLQEGRSLMLSWNGTDTIEIQNGLHDDWIRTQATAVRELEQPVMLRWLWEMDANRRRDWVHSGEDFVGAWNHIRGIFDEVGADNAQFVWCPNAFLFWDTNEGGGNPDEWYPGDENVDWLCADGYNWGDRTTDRDWMTFTDIFEEFVAWAEPRNLPIVIAETGSNEALDDPNARADWLRNIPDSLRNDLPAIDAVIYFDKDFTFLGHPDWRLDTTPQAFAAWNEISRDEYLNPLG